VAYANSFNRQQTGSLELLIGKKMRLPPGGSPIDQILTDLSLCGDSQGNCLGRHQNFEALDSALAGGTGLMTSTDYRGVSVMSAYSYSAALAAGIVFKVDISEMTRPLMMGVLILVLAAVGVVVIGCVVLHFAARRLLSNIEKIWEKSKRLVQEEKVRTPDKDSQELFFSAGGRLDLVYKRSRGPKQATSNKQTWSAIPRTWVSFGPREGGVPPPPHVGS